MTRRPDWPERLNDFIECCRSRAFHWGRYDCATFAFEAIRAITGEDICGEFRGEYSNAFGAVLTMRRRYAARDLGECAKRVFSSSGCTAIAPRMAKRGDILLVRAPENAKHFPGVALAVSLGQHAAAPGKSGLVFVPSQSALMAWSI